MDRGSWQATVHGVAKSWTQLSDFTFTSLKHTYTGTALIKPKNEITADGDCSHEIKRRLLLGGKVMTNLDSIVKSRDITWSTEVRLFKDMVFPVVMYGCENWTIKKAKHQKN